MGQKGQDRSQKSQDRLSRRERRAQKRIVAKENKRQCKVAEKRDLQSRSFVDITKQAILQLQQNALPLFAFLAAIFVFYFPALSGEFIWDDVLFSEEKTIHDWSSLWDIWFAPSEIAGEGHYWPITYTTFWLEHKLFGLNPLGYHIVNCTLYFINVVLIWRLLLRLEVPGAWAISMIFTVHPLHVESVAWLIERKDLLSALFYLGAVHVWLRFRESSSLKTYALALGLYALGMLSKSIAVTLPAALLVLLWWKQERVSAQDIMRLLPFFIVGFAITLGDYLFYVSREEQLNITFSFLERILIAAQALWFYVGKLLWPTNLMVIYPHWDVSVEDLISWLFMVAAVGVLALLWGYRHRIGKGPLAGVAFFVITLLPIFGFVDHKYMQFSFVADRYQYLAGLGLIAVVVGGAVHAIQLHITSFKPVVIGAFTVMVVGLGVLTWHQAAIYQDGVTFFRHIIAHNPTARDAHHNLGNVLFKKKRYEDALEVLQEALEQNPDSPALTHMAIADSYHKLGQHAKAMEWIERARTLTSASFSQDKLSKLSVKVLLALGRTEEAEQHLLQAAWDSDSYHEVWRLLNLLQMSAKQGDVAQTSAYLQHILELAEGNLETLLVTADILREQKQYAEAIEIYKRMLAIDLNFDKAHAGMGDALFRLGRYEEAIESLERSVELTPISSSATAPFLLMGQAASKLGRSADAAQYYERAIEIDPQNASALEHLASTRFQEKRYEDALRLFSFMRDNFPRDAHTHSNIGATLYHLGRLQESAHSYKAALLLDPSMEHIRSGLEKLAKEIEQQE